MHRRTLFWFPLAILAVALPAAASAQGQQGPDKVTLRIAGTQ
jgi:hypothetical protein